MDIFNYVNNSLDTSDMPLPQSYQKCSSESKENSIKHLPSEIQDIIGYASMGLMYAQNGTQRMEHESLCMMFNLVQDSCSRMLKIPSDQCNIVGSAFSLLLSYRHIRENEYIARAIADYAFFAFTKAIKANPFNENLHVKRLSVLAETRDFFYFTIANALDLPTYNAFDFFASMPLMVRTNKYLFSMVKHDLSFISKKNFNGTIGDLITASTNSMSKCTDKDGAVCIEKIMTYLTDTFKKY